MIVKNEADILKEVLDKNSWLDAIVAIDNGSTDGTWKILQEHYLVKELFYDDHEFDETYFVPNLHSIAERFKADWYVDVDADEIYDEKIRGIIEKCPDKYNTLSVTIKYMLKDKCYREHHNWARVYRNLPELFNYSCLGKLHKSKLPIKKEDRVTLDTWVDVYHYQIRNREQGLRKYERYKKLDPNNFYQPTGYEHLKELSYKCLIK